MAAAGSRRMLFVVFALALILTQAHAKDLPPNVIIMLADNLGYADVSFLGAPAGRTPNIDRLAKEGMQFQHWNSAAHLCSASRATLLTGKYAARTGVYPSVFANDAVYGLMPFEVSIANYLKEEGYATSLVGKWHLGHRPPYLPTKQGFDEWLGIPFHMSGGSLDNHVCSYDEDQSWWLPLYDGDSIVEQPVKLNELSKRYASRATGFIKEQVGKNTPFFLYLAFSHVHQLCAPKDGKEQETCQWTGSPTADDTVQGLNKTFGDAVAEMDWIVGEVTKMLDSLDVANNTFVLFTSDNGPWLAEQSCSGAKGPFHGRWLADNVDQNCIACPHDFEPCPTNDRPRRCRLRGVNPESEDAAFYLDGVHCGEDVGLGSLWEANLRMPAVARQPGKIRAGASSSAVVSTLDVFPTVLSFLNASLPPGLDGMDISSVLFGREHEYDSANRTLFFWRDGFSEGSLPPPYGRLDVAAVKIGHMKAHLYTKSAHYNDDDAVHHVPPLLFDVHADPAEAFPLNPDDHKELLARMEQLVKTHKESIEWTTPLALAKDPKYRPCADPQNGCRTGAGLPERVVLNGD